MAAVYLFFGIFLHRQAAAPDADQRPVLLALGIALSFLTLAIPIQFTGFTITIAWAIQAAALTWIACRFQSTRMMVGALVVFGLVAGRLLLFEAETLPDPLSYSLLWNTRFSTFAVSAVAMLLAAFWTAPILKPAALISYFAGNFFLLWGLCLEIVGWAARSASAGQSFECGDHRYFHFVWRVRRASGERGRGDARCDSSPFGIGADRNC